jgi:hypothetical protein
MPRFQIVNISDRPVKVISYIEAPTHSEALAKARAMNPNYLAEPCSPAQESSTSRTAQLREESTGERQPFRFVLEGFPDDPITIMAESREHTRQRLGGLVRAAKASGYSGHGVVEFVRGRRTAGTTRAENFHTY